MNELEAIKNRHSVRSYLDKPIAAELVQKLNEEIKKANDEAGIHLQLIIDNEAAFNGLLPKFGRFRGVRNYIAMVANGSMDSYEACGYYGAKLAILAQQLGLNTCFVLGTYKKSACIAKVDAGEKLLGVISIGYGQDQGKQHKSKALEKLGMGTSDWFKAGLDAAVLAPTGLNKQNFFLEEQSEKVVAKPTAGNAMTRMDLGIVKYHFEVGSGKDKNIWVS